MSPIAPTQHRTITAAVATLLAALALAGPASAGQDLRSPDTRDAAAAQGIDLRSPDVRDLATAAQPVAPHSVEPSGSGGLEPVPLAVGGAVLLLTGLAWSSSRRRRRMRQALAGTGS